MKQIKVYRFKDEIPSNAKFLFSKDHGNEHSFYYEVPIIVKNNTKKDTNFDNIAQNVINHLNEITGKKYSYKSKETIKLITARLRDGYDETDLLTAVDNMCNAWLEDPKMSQYLRPHTLFRASKFEGYLNFKSEAEQAHDAFDELGSYYE